jgi:hypothetical protein
MRAPRTQRPFELLVRHFFGRFFDTESLSPQGEPSASITQTLGILAVPSAFFVLLFRPLLLTGWSLVGVRYLFLAYSMIVMGFIMVFEWGALFPDRRDYQILTTLPIRLARLFLAKALALAIFLGIFLIDINLFSVLFWPGIDSAPGLWHMLGVHIAVVAGAGLFSALAIAALQGIMITLLPVNVYRRASVVVQTGLMAILVMLLFLAPLMAFRIQWLVNSDHPLLYWFPGFWFVGLYEQLRPATRAASLAGLGGMAWWALACAAAVFVLTFLPFYRRHARRSLESPAPARASASALATNLSALLDRVLLKHPVEQGVFHFISQTIARSVKHRYFLAIYGGFGAAIAVITLGAGTEGLLRLPLSLSFVLVSGLRAAFNFPSELPANWSFQLTETAGVRQYLSATRKWVVCCAILPLFALLAAMEFACFPWTAALFHLAFGIALSVLLMQILFFDFRKVPFTCAHFPGKVNLVGLGVVYILGFTMYSRWMARLEAWLYGQPIGALLVFACIAAACALLRRRPETAALDYVERADPVVRTLDLTPQ